MTVTVYAIRVGSWYSNKSVRDVGSLNLYDYYGETYHKDHRLQINQSAFWMNDSGKSISEELRISSCNSSGLTLKIFKNTSTIESLYKQASGYVILGINLKSWYTSSFIMSFLWKNTSFNYESLGFSIFYNDLNSFIFKEYESINIAYRVRYLNFVYDYRKVFGNQVYNYHLFFSSEKPIGFEVIRTVGDSIYIYYIYLNINSYKDYSIGMGKGDDYKFTLIISENKQKGELLLSSFKEDFQFNYQISINKVEEKSVTFKITGQYFTGAILLGRSNDYTKYKTIVILQKNPVGSEFITFIDFSDYIVDNNLSFSKDSVITINPSKYKVILDQINTEVYNVLSNDAGTKMIIMTVISKIYSFFYFQYDLISNTWKEVSESSTDSLKMKETLNNSYSTSDSLRLAVPQFWTRPNGIKCIQYTYTNGWQDNPSNVYNYDITFDD